MGRPLLLRCYVFFIPCWCNLSVCAEVLPEGGKHVLAKGGTWSVKVVGMWLYVVGSGRYVVGMMRLEVCVSVARSNCVQKVF